jgi:hypothetical protein
MDLSSTIHVSDKVQPGNVIMVSETDSLKKDLGVNTENLIQIPNKELDEYDPKDIHKYSVTVAGLTYDFFYVKKGTKKSKALLIAKKQCEVKSLKSRLEQAENELRELTGD